MSMSMNASETRRNRWFLVASYAFVGGTDCLILGRRPSHQEEPTTG
jgi:hypothetical protein